VIPGANFRNNTAIAIVFRWRGGLVTTGKKGTGQVARGGIFVDYSSCLFKGNSYIKLLNGAIFLGDSGTGKVYNFDRIIFLSRKPLSQLRLLAWIWGAQ
jgi:hypothetical protein